MWRSHRVGRFRPVSTARLIDELRATVAGKTLAVCEVFWRQAQLFGKAIELSGLIQQNVHALAVDAVLDRAFGHC